LITDNIFPEAIVVNKEFVFILTTLYSAIERAAGKLQLAVNMAAFDANIDFFLMNESAFLAKKGIAESITYKKAFYPVAKLTQCFWGISTAGFISACPV
jgi:predicted peroxiredoxin